MAQQNGYRVTLLHYEINKFDEDYDEDIDEERELIDSWRIGFKK